MDLIYTDANRIDIGALKDYDIDLEIGENNDFQITTNIKNNVLDAGTYFYFEGTEFGGKVSKVKVDTKLNRIYYSGKTFYGMLEDKIICPDSGQDYLTLSGDANEIIDTLITRLGLSNLFTASTEISGFTFANYKFDRYIDGYKGIRKMLRTKNAKLKATLLNQFVSLSAVPISDYTSDEFTSDVVNFTIEQNKRPVNHLICLGQGDLSDRTIVHLYVGSNGQVSTTKYYTGLDEVTDVYDYSSVESLEELISSGTEKLLEYQEADKIDITIENTEKDVGDIVGGDETVTGISTKGFITKKIVKISNNGKPKFTYEVGV